MVNGGHVHHRTDVVDRIHRPRRWGDIQRRRVFIAVWRGHGVDEGIRRFDVIGPDTAVQGVGVFPVRINGQGAIFPLNGGDARPVDRHAVHRGDVGARRDNVIRQHIAGGAAADA
ncbi:hypothetical protein D3C76_1184830 [compost metagenome]